MTRPNPASTAATITPEQRLSVVRHLANGRGLDFTATATGLTPDLVRDIGSAHGWPREESLAKAADVLAERLDEQAKATITERPDLAVAEHRQQRALRNNNRPAPPPARPEPPAPRLVDPTSDLLRRGKTSPRKRTQQLADRIGRDLERLRDAIATEERAAAEQAQKEKERQAALDEVRKAEQALAAARAKLRRHKNHPGGNGRANVVGVTEAVRRTRTHGGRAAGNQASAARAAGGLVTTEQLQQRGLTSKTLRAWAADHDVDCPTAGRVPRRVLDAYDQQHHGAAS